MSIVRLQNLALMYVCLWVTSPVLLPSTLGRLGAVFAMLVWAGLELMRPNSIFLRPTIPVLGVVVFIAYDIYFWLLLKDWVFASHIQLYIILIFIVVYESRRNEIASLKPIFWFVLLTIPIWIITTLRALDTYSHAVRVVVRSSAEALELLQQGVGGYSLVYGALLLVPMLVPMVLRGAAFDLRSAPAPIRLLPFYNRVLPAVLVGIITLLVLRSGFAIANVVLVIALIVSVLLTWFREWGIALGILGAVVLLVGGNILLGDLIAALQSLTQDTTYADRLRDVQLALEVGESTGTVQDRTERYWRSANSFLDNPVMGTIVESRGIGGHSAYLDALAQRGIVFGGLFVALMLYLPIRMLRQLPANISMTGGVLTMMIVFPTLNSMTAIFGVMLFVMYPAACAMTQEYAARFSVSTEHSTTGVALRTS